MMDVSKDSFDVLVNIRSYSDDELRELSERLQREEREISRERRIIHGKLDIIRAEIVRRLRDKHKTGDGLFREEDIDSLSAILSGRPGVVEDSLSQD